MNVVKLTNLGNLTLANLGKLNEKYEENAKLKHKKLAKLWSTEEEMISYYNIFSTYKSDNPKGLIVKTDEGFGLLSPLFPRDVLLDNTPVELIGQFEKLGLVRIEETAKPLEELLTEVSTERYTNPIADLDRVTVELTGLCNLKCKHCYRGGSRPDEYGLDVEKIKASLDPLLRAGVSSINFTGGEVTIRKKDLLELIDYLSQYLELKGIPIEEKMIYKYGMPNPTVEDVIKTDYYVNLRQELMEQLSWPESKLRPGMWNIFDKHTSKDVENLVRNQAEWHLEYEQKSTKYSSNLDSVGILSNGCFDDQEIFIEQLKSYHVSMQTSLDSYNGHRTNKNRGKRGVFGKVKNLVKLASEKEFDLSICAHNMGGAKTKREKYHRTYFDHTVPTRELDDMLQFGNAVNGDFKTSGQRTQYNYIGALSSSNQARNGGYCSGWKHPRKIHIRPTGNVGNCLYAYAVPTEFGNLNTSSMIEILNGIQNSEVYKMFQNRKMDEYHAELDKSLFPKKFSSECELRVITLTYGIIKERLIAEGVKDPVQKANLEVARLYKFKS